MTSPTGSSAPGDEPHTAHIAEQLVHQFTFSGRTIACAESLTAGLVCATIADVPGASKVLRGGLVVYATDLKESLAGVDRGVLDEHGAVSQPTAEMLADSVRHRCRADVGVATTGVAGPDPQEGKAPGVVWIAVASSAGVESRQLKLSGDRRAIREATVEAVLQMALDA